MVNVDEVVLVNEADEVVGRMEKLAAHRHPARLHRAVSVWLKNADGRFLFQLRSPRKIVGAGWWGNTICGNVWPRESYEACARRRLRVELGIEWGGVQSKDGFRVKPGMTETSGKSSKPVLLKPRQKFHYQAYANPEFGENEIDQIFVGSCPNDIQLQLNPDEVSEVLWLEYAEVKEKVLAAIGVLDLEYPTAGESILLNEEELKQQTPPVEIEVEKRKILFTPWTVMMIFDLDF